MGGIGAHLMLDRSLIAHLSSDTAQNARALAGRDLVTNDFAVDVVNESEAVEVEHAFGSFISSDDVCITYLMMRMSVE